MTALIDKLQKLVAHERSARNVGSIAEAEVFAAKIGQMLFAHKLTMSEVEIAEETDAPVGQGRVFTARAGWAGTLALGVAESAFCRVLQSSNGYIFIGRESDRMAAVAMFNHLVRMGRGLAASQVKLKIGGFPSWDVASATRHWKKSFLAGYVDAIYHRLQGERKAETLAAENSGASLVWIRKAEEDVTAYMAATYPNLGKGRKTTVRVNGDAYQRGQSCGSQVSLQARAALA